MAASQEKQMEVCEVCGAFLIVGDAQQRIDDHLTGKQHVGFAKLRQAIQEIRDVSVQAQSVAARTGLCRLTSIVVGGRPKRMQNTTVLQVHSASIQSHLRLFDFGNISCVVEESWLAYFP